MPASLLSRFLTAKAAAGLSAGTLEWYRREIANLLVRIPPHEAMPSTATVEAYLAARRARGIQPATLAGHHRALSAFFKWLVERNVIAPDENPMRLIAKPRIPRKEPRQAQFAEFTRLLQSLPHQNWIDYRDRLGIATIFLAAVRVAELVALTIDDYDLVGEQLVIRRGKGGDARRVPLLPAAKIAFAAYMMERPPWAGREVFLGADGGSLGVSNALTVSGFRQMLKRRCKQAGMKYLNPHSFRHGLAMHLLNDKGADMALIQRILGHSTIQVTAAIYARWRDDGAARRYRSIMTE